jgi:hypothetical protein
MPVTEADLDGYSLQQLYHDGRIVRIAVRRTTAEAYSSGWRYTLHYGATDTGESAVPTLSDGTIRRYDNAHEATKGHELHLAPDPEPTLVEFPGMVSLYERFWREIPKPQIKP